MSEYVKLAVELVSVIYVLWLQRIHLDFFQFWTEDAFLIEGEVSLKHLQNSSWILLSQSPKSLWEHSLPPNECIVTNVKVFSSLRQPT